MFIERFIKYLQYEKRYSPHTIAAYWQDLEQFDLFLTSSALTAEVATSAEIRQWIMSMMDAGARSRSINRKASALRSFYNFLIREDIIGKNPMLNVQALKTPKQLPVVISDKSLAGWLDQAQASIKVWDNQQDSFSQTRDLLVVELLFCTGIRSAELIGLKESDVDNYKKCIRVLGKRKKERIIPVIQSLLTLIETYREIKKMKLFHNNTGELIVTNTGNKSYPKFIYRIVKSCLSNISTNGKNSPHVLRHTFATSLLNNGADLNAIKELLGHKSLAATQVYTHNTVDRLKSIYKQAHPKA